MPQLMLLKPIFSLKEIKEAVYQLPEIFKNPFELYFEGYKYHEIAEVLQEPWEPLKADTFCPETAKTAVKPVLM